MSQESGTNLTEEIDQDLLAVRQIFFSFLNLEEETENQDSFYGGNSYHFYTKMFQSPPTKQVFRWSAGAYEGRVFVLYKYFYKTKNYFASIDGRYGSCSHCDGLESCVTATEYNRKIMKLAEKVEFYKDLSEIKFGIYEDADLKQAFSVFVKSQMNDFGSKQ